MPDLAPLSPLMQPIAWEDQEYFSSQYFYHKYITNSPHSGKHRRFDNFMRLLRSIPAYALYTEQGAIVEINWTALKQEQPHLCGYFKDFFQAAGWQPLTLLNATAQVELSHHLDDAVSQQMAVTSSTLAARQMMKPSGTTIPEELAIRKLRAWQELGKLLGTPEHIVQQEAVKQIAADTGINLHSLLLAAPAQQSIKDDEKMLEPNDLAKALGLSSGMLLNAHLHAIGWQIPKIGGGFEATPAGKPYCTTHAWVAGNKSGYNYKWNLEAVRDILGQYGRLPEPPPQQEQLPI
jgi:hypothetical protein